MADLTGPFESKPWSQTEWYGFAPVWAPSGIIGAPAASVGVGDFAVTASGLSVAVACNADRAWIDGSGYKPDSDKTVTVTANGNASLSRRDRLVIHRDLAAQTIDVIRLQGTAAGTPSAPALTQTTGGVYELPVCSFLVPPNNGTALTGFIDERVWIRPDGHGLAGAEVLLGPDVGPGGTIGAPGPATIHGSRTIDPAALFGPGYGAIVHIEARLLGDVTGSVVWDLDIVSPALSGTILAKDSKTFATRNTLAVQDTVIIPPGATQSFSTRLSNGSGSITTYADPVSNRAKYTVRPYLP